MPVKRTKKSALPIPVEIKEYDSSDTSTFINTSKPLSFESIGFKLPEVALIQVISIRLPTALLNEIKAMGSQQDVPYQAQIKLFLSEAVNNKSS